MTTLDRIRSIRVRAAVATLQSQKNVGNLMQFGPEFPLPRSHVRSAFKIMQHANEDAFFVAAAFRKRLRRNFQRFPVDRSRGRSDSRYLIFDSVLHLPSGRWGMPVLLRSIYEENKFFALFETFSC